MQTSPRRGPLMAWAVAVVLSLWLGGCGPGVGGTGTDSVSGAFALWGAQSVPNCAGCPAAPLSPTDSAPAVFAGPAGSAAVLVAYQGQEVVLDDRCPRLRFIGQWGITPSGNRRFYGIYGALGSSDLEAAALSVSVQADGSQTLVLRDLFERVLLGPVTVSRAGLPLPDARCP